MWKIKKYHASFLVLLLVFSYFFILFPTSSAQVWYDTNFRYNKTHVIESLVGADVNYQVNFTAHYGSGVDSAFDVYLDSFCRTDFADLRVYNSTGGLLPAWNQTQVNSDYVIIWTKISANLTASSETISLYFGNASASSYWDQSTVFVDVIPGVVGAWNMEEVSGTNVNDFSSYNNDGTATATVTDGKFTGKSARAFDGSQYITIPDANQLDFTTAISVFLFFKTDGVVDNTRLFDKDRDTAFRLHIDAARYAWFAGKVGGAVQTKQMIPQYTASVWNNIGYVTDGVNWNFYLNGASANSGIYATSGEIAVNAVQLVIGGNYVPNGNYFNGSMCELFFTNTLLTLENYQNLNINYPDVTLEAGKVCVRKYVGSDGPTQGAWGELEIAPFYATSTEVLYGTQANGTLTDLHIGNPNITQFNEASGYPNIDIRFNFTDLPELTYHIQIFINQMYDGNPAHQISVDLWNFTSNAWIQYGTLDNSNVYYWVNISISEATNHFIQGGTLNLRLFHIQSGVPTHKLYINTLYIIIVQDYSPGFSNVGFTTNVAGALNLFHAYVTDHDNDLSYWFFRSNITGPVTDSDPIYFTSTLAEWANISYYLPNVDGAIVAYQFFVFCSDNDYAVSSERYVIIEEADPTPTPTPDPNAITADDALAIGFLFGIIGIAFAFALPLVYCIRRRRCKSDGSCEDSYIE